MAKYLKFFFIFILVGTLKCLFASAKPAQNKESVQKQIPCQEMVRDKDGIDICLGDIYEDPVEYKCLLCNRLIKCNSGYFKDRKGNCREILTPIRPRKRNKL